MYSFNEPRYFFIANTANHQPLVIIFVVFCIGLPYENFTRIHESSICNINHIYFITQIKQTSHQGCAQSGERWSFLSCLYCRVGFCWRLNLITVCFELHRKAHFFVHRPILWLPLSDQNYVMNVNLNFPRWGAWYVRKSRPTTLPGS